MTTAPEAHANKAPYLHLLDAGRAVASVAVVGHHVGAIAAKQHGVQFLGGVLSLGELRPDFFFVLSGFIITWIHGSELGRAGQVLNFLRKRFWRLYPLLFLLTTTKLAAVLAFGGGRWSQEPLDWQVIVSSYLMLPTPGYPLLLAAWTMPFEIVFYLFFAIGILTGKRALLATAVLWTAGVFICHLTTPHPDFPLSFWFHPYFLQLLAGVLAGLVARRRYAHLPGRTLLAVGMILTLAGLLSHHLLQDWPLIWSRSFWALSFGTLILGAAIYELRRQKPVWIPRWLKTLGRASYSTYLVHGPVLVILLSALAGASMLAGSTKDLALAASGAVAITGGLLCHRFIERPLLNFSRRMRRPTPLLFKL